MKTKQPLFMVTAFIFLIYSVTAIPIPLGTLYNNASYQNITTYVGNEQLTHPCVLYNETGWNGYKYLMGFTPYPFTQSIYENPSMRYSNDGFNWIKIPGQPDPVIGRPSIGYLSDPCIEVKNETLFLFYRYANQSPDTDIVYYNYTTTTDGVIWTTPVKMTMEKTRSSSFIYNGTGWESWGHNVTTGKLTHFTTDDLVTWTQSGSMEINTTGYTPWHSEVKKYDNRYMLLISETPYKDLRFYTSSDGLFWSYEHNRTPVLTGNLTTGAWDKELYKSSFVELNNTYKVWYAGIDNVTNHMRIGYTAYPGASTPPATSSITVTAPNGGETWQRGTPHTITWDYTCLLYTSDAADE